MLLLEQQLLYTTGLHVCQRQVRLLCQCLYGTNCQLPLCFTHMCAHCPATPVPPTWLLQLCLLGQSLALGAPWVTTPGPGGVPIPVYEGVAPTTQVTSTNCHDECSFIAPSLMATGVVSNQRYACLMILSLSGPCVCLLMSDSPTCLLAAANDLQSQTYAMSVLHNTVM